MARPAPIAGAALCIFLVTASPVEPPGRLRAPPPFLDLSLSFEANRGQADPGVDFLARGAGYTVFLASSEVLLAPRRSTDSFKLKFVGASLGRPEGVEPLPGRSNYLRGADPSRWVTDVPHFARVRYRDLYPGVDVVYYGRHRELEYDLVVAPGADPSAIAFRFEGAAGTRLDEKGDLVLSGGSGGKGEVVQSAPVLYQEIEGRRVDVGGAYAARADGGFGIEVASYDRLRPLVIDPILSYSTFLGGNVNDECLAIALDSSGNHYITGRTNSTTFPAQGPIPGGGANIGNYDAFVTKLNATLSGPLIYSTYIGGSDDDEGHDIAVDSSNRAYIVGRTKSNAFPLQAPFDGTANGGFDGFALRLSAAGNALEYSTFLGGSGDDEAHGIALDGANNAYVTGRTNSTGFPTTAGVAQPANAGGFDAFAAKLNAAGSAGGLVYSTFHGGNSDDIGNAIALDGAGNAYIVGSTASGNLPTVAPFQAANAGGDDVFVAKFNAGATARVYSTYIGGGSTDHGEGIAVDGAGSAYVGGYTVSADYDVTASAFDSTYNGGVDIIVTKLSPAGNAISYSTFLGGSSDDFGYDITVDAAGKAAVAGASQSTNFPIVNAIQGAVGDYEAIVTQFNAAGSGLVFSTYLGGTNSETAYGIASRPGGEFCVAGVTASPAFPVSPGAFDSTFDSGTYDGFVACFGESEILIGDVSVTEGVAASFSVTLTRPSVMPITVQYVTGDFTAVAPGDYTALAPATLTFPAGTTTQTITVATVADTVAELDERFSVILFAPTSGVTIGDGRGVGTILNDDGPFTPPPDV